MWILLDKLWKILKETGIPDHLTCLLRNLYAGKEATLRTRYGTTDWFKIGKGVRQGRILTYSFSPHLFNLYAEYIMRNPRLEEAQAGIKIVGRNINITSDIQRIPPSCQKVKSLLMKVKSESEVAQSCPTHRPHGLKPTRLLRPWDFPGKSTGVDCH